jgi:hypothetical protein
MIAYAILCLVSLFTQKCFWKAWAICSALATVYSLTLGVYFACKIENIPYTFHFDWLAITMVTVYTFAITLVQRFIDFQSDYLVS